MEINSFYIMFEGIFTRILGGSPKGPLLFTIYIDGMFLNWDNSDIANYANDNSSALKGIEIAREN